MVYLSLARPTKRDEAQTLDESAARGFNYAPAHIGATQRAPPLQLPGEARTGGGAANAGYVIDHNRVRIGTGGADFARAQGLLEKWGQFQLGWATVDARTPLKKAANVCVCAKTLLLWSRNPLQVVYVDTVPPPDCKKRFAFAHGTLLGHLLAGEERFAVEWRRADDSVWFDIFTFSRPGCLLAKLSYPVARAQQRAFAKQSMAAVAAAMKR